MDIHTELERGSETAILRIRNAECIENSALYRSSLRLTKTTERERKEKGKKNLCCLLLCPFVLFVIPIYLVIVIVISSNSI